MTQIPMDDEVQEQRPVKGKFILLKTFGRDLTEMAENGDLDEVVGREDETDRIIQILSRRKKNNPVLVGEPGVGKTAIVEGIARRIVEGGTNRILEGKKIFSLDLSSIVAGTKYRGQFKERMKALLHEIENSDNVIIFIDEVHTIVGAGNSAGSLDLSNMIKPALARGTMQCIGATTLDEYKKSIEKDSALDRRFQKVMVEPPTLKETKTILMNIKHNYEDFHVVNYSEDTVDACVSFAERYITARHFPDKAIDIMDEVGARVRIDNTVVSDKVVEMEGKLKVIKSAKKGAVDSQRYEQAAQFRDDEKDLLHKIFDEKEQWLKESKKNKALVSVDDVSKVVSKITGIPVTRLTEDESSRLLKMEETLTEKIIGQPEAVKYVCEAILRSRAGVQNPKKPIGSFLFLGPTGVGKTELSKALAEYLFGTADALIKIDMSEYMEKHSISKMLGSPPGYVGYDEGGQLADKIRNRPYSVVLFDEIEKAHKDVSNVLLQILDEGKMTDGLGRDINFKNTVVIMTSNLGTSELSIKPVGFETNVNKDMDIRGIVKKALSKFFKPEFLNRIDEQVIFSSLDNDSIKAIAEMKINESLRFIEEQGIKLCYTKRFLEFISAESYSEEYGARPVLRAITKYVENTVSTKILSGSIERFSGKTYELDYNEKQDKVSIKEKIGIKEKK